MNFEQLYEKLQKHNAVLENSLLKKDINDKVLDNIISDIKSISNQELILESKEEAIKLNEIISSIFEKVNQIKKIILENTQQVDNQRKALEKYSKY